MNNRQKRLCRILLDFYDSSGAQPCPLAQLARKAGYDASDIYDKDSQSGDLWPFDGKARGNYSGMLLFTGGKNPTVSITSAGLVSLENLCGEAPAPAKPARVSESPKPVPAPIKPVTTPPVPPPVRAVTAPPTPAPVPVRVMRSAKPFPVPVTSAASVPPIAPPPRKAPVSSTKPASSPSFPSYSSSDIAEGWSHFIVWLDTDPAAVELLENFKGRELIEAAFGKFLGDFLKHRGA
ncbi:MAG TPA: hypothetical protein VGM64_04735 [Lacunisphaera sp.]